MKNTKKIRKGFTLVELIVVIAIIAILAAVSVAGYYGFIASANQSAADQEAAQVKNVIRAAATQGVKEGTSKIGDNTLIVTTSYTWTLNGLEAGAEERETATVEGETIAAVTYLDDLVAIANAFGGLTLENKEDTGATADKAGLDDVKVKGTTAEDAKIIVSVTYVSAKNITSVINFTL